MLLKHPSPASQISRGSVVCAMTMLSCCLGISNLAAVHADEPTAQTTDQPVNPPSIEANADGVKFFEAKIRPVLVEHCYRCHSADGIGVRGGLSVDSRDALAAGGESGPAVVPGNLEDSVLWNAINYRDYKMPPKTRLPAAVIADFKTWIEMGAPDPRVLEAKIVRSKVSAEDIERGKQFWAFATPHKNVPDIQRKATWWKTDIDRFVEATWQEHEIEPNPDTQPHLLLRRLTYDLIGLPPTMDELAAFERAWAKNADEAIKKTVDELLSRPQYGERWGRHWLDVARYAESTGKEVDVTFPNAWRYRNYVIDAFNNDKPYDQFVREQIAGDLLPAKSDAEWTEHLIATGFLALGPKSLSEQNPRQFQADLIDEQIDSTTRVFLGMSVACARCHDHKFDPIPQTDYYALAGIFQSTKTLYGGVRSQRNRQPSSLIILPIDDPNPSDKPLTKGEIAELKKLRDEREKEYREARRAMNSPAAASTATKGRETTIDPRRNLLNAGLLDQVVAQLSTQINSVDSDGRPLTFCMGVQEADAPREARVLVRGEIDQPAQSVPRGLVQVLCSSPVNIPNTSTGRLELAKWLASRENPLAARVMVNRIWQHMLGKALVREPDNFGASGPAATHPELLDFLAMEFMDHGWSIKHLIREIACSRVYRLSSQFDQVLFEKDPDNRLLARANVRRLDAEALRDAMLAVGGQLDLKRPKSSPIAEFGATIIGPNGPTVLPAALVNMTDGSQPSGMMAGALRAGLRPGGGNVLERPNYKRSVYLPIVRNSVPRSLDAFDFAEPSLVVGQRETSHTADQALYMLNNPFVIEQSEAMARRMIAHSDSMAERVGYAFKLIYGRAATAEELRSAGEFLRTAASESSNETRQQRAFRACSLFCQALVSSAEFRFVN